MIPASYAPIYVMLYPALAETCRLHGYALAVHGSLKRDFDLVCVPWITQPTAPELVVSAIADKFSIEPIGGLTEKAHNRSVQTLSFGGESFLDLSFMAITPPNGGE